MTIFVRVVGAAIAILGATAIVTHHKGYLRRVRPLTFGAFLQTGGWIILTLVGVAAAAGGVDGSQMRPVEVAQVIVGVLCVSLGGRFK